MSLIHQLPDLKTVIAKYDLAAKHRFGQHFLLGLNITDKIAKLALPLGNENIIEIGPGPGGLTRSLLGTAGVKNLYVIEKDWRFIPPLEEIASKSEGALHIRLGDALELSFTDIASPPYRVIANLPYNIATPLITKWLYMNGEIQDMILMVQKEVGDRLCAKTGDENFGRLSVLAGLRAEVSKCFDLPPSAFTPPPKVMSSVIHIRLKPLDSLKGIDSHAFEAISKAAFGQRRKMLRKALETLDISAVELLKRANIDGTRRAETLEISEFIALSKAYMEFKKIP